MPPKIQEVDPDATTASDTDSNSTTSVGPEMPPKIQEVDPDATTASDTDSDSATSVGHIASGFPATPGPEVSGKAAIGATTKRRHPETSDEDGEDGPRRASKRTRTQPARERAAGSQDLEATPVFQYRRFETDEENYIPPPWFVRYVQDTEGLPSGAAVDFSRAKVNDMIISWAPEDRAGRTKPIGEPRRNGEPLKFEPSENHMMNPGHPLIGDFLKQSRKDCKGATKRLETLRAKEKKMREEIAAMRPEQERLQTFVSIHEELQSRE